MTKGLTHDNAGYARSYLQHYGRTPTTCIWTDWAAQDTLRVCLQLGNTSNRSLPKIALGKITGATASVALSSSPMLHNENSRNTYSTVPLYAMLLINATATYSNMSS